MTHPAPPVAVPAAVDVALRRLTLAANHGVLWLGIGAVGTLAGGRYRRAALRGMASLSMASFVSNSLIKPLVGRRRPEPTLTALARRIASVPWTSSFPSGHSASAAAFAAGVALEMPAAGAVLAPLAAAVAYSRVHVGVHYRSDAVVGVLVGAATALVGKHFWPVKPHGGADLLRASAPALDTGSGLTIVVNQASGTAAGFDEGIAGLLPEAMIVTWDPATESLADLIGPDVRAVGVAGGDGTTASVAELAAERGLPLAVFPRGTFNHFAKALGLHTDMDTVTAVAQGSAGLVDLARINGATFLNTASIGGYPDLVRRRDRLSGQIGKWPAAAYALYRTMRHHSPIDLVINGHHHTVWLVFIGNGVYRPRGLAPAWREQLSAGVLDVQYLRADVPYARAKAVVLSLLGLVERSPVFGDVQASDVTILSRSGPLPAAHDGEVTAPVETVELTVAARALTVYC